MSDQNEARAPRGLSGDIHRAREGAQASAAELREFVRQFRGRSPHEMLGLVAGSNLVQATAMAAVVTFVFMAAFTVGPYIYKKANPVAAKPSKPAAAAPAAAPSATAASTAPTPVASTTGTAAAPPAVATGTGPAQPDVLGTLGIGETKSSDPKKNPLEAGADDLLKDLK